MQLTIGFSPCPNDTFIFDALVNGKIDTEGITFEPVLQDVETLNKNAIEGCYDISKISYGVYPLVYEQYIILNSGSALGRGVGPLLIANKKMEAATVSENLIAIPGAHTTAHFLFSNAFPEALQKVFLSYHEIEDFVIEGKGLGVIIHENRFTYEQKGLYKIIDLGEHWEKKTNQPIPLGGIVIKRTISQEIQMKVDRLIRSSIEYAYKNSGGLNDYIRSNAQEMEDATMKKHIALYVNDYSINLGANGRASVERMMNFFDFQIKEAKPLFL